MSSSVLSVEERLRVSLLMCEALTYCAIFEDIPPPPLPPPNYTPREVLDSLSTQLLSIKAALPRDCLATRAPSVRRPR